MPKMKTLPAHTAKALRKAGVLLVILLLLGCTVFMLLYRVDQQVIFSFDEGRHGVTAYEMLQNSDLIMSTNRGAPDFYNLKPPLSFWAIMLGYKLFGFTVLGFRFQCLLSIFLLFVLVAAWMYRRHGALSSVVALALLAANVAFFERTSDADELYWLITTASLLCMLDSDRDIRWLYGSALGFGFAFLAKSYHAALIPIVCLAYLLMTGRIRKLKGSNYLLLIVFGLLPIAPWAVARYLRDGTAFFVAMFRTDVAERIATAGPPWYFYLADLASNPSVILSALLGVSASIHHFIRRGRPTNAQIGLAAWIVLPVVLFSLITYKLYHYVYPVLSAFAISGGLATVYWARCLRGRILRTLCAAALTVCLVAAIGSNVRYSMDRDPRGSYQTALSEMFDRNVDSGLHVYIQSDAKTTEWAQCDILCALLAGDVLCLDGGVEAFESDEEPAVVIVDNQCMDNSLLENYPVYYDSQYLTALSN